MLNGKAIIIYLIVVVIKRHRIKWVNIFLNHMSLLEETLMSIVSLSNYATKVDLKKQQELICLI